VDYHASTMYNLVQNFEFEKLKVYLSFMATVLVKVAYVNLLQLPYTAATNLAFCIQVRTYLNAGLYA
jgi:hypothetical protein